MTQENYNDASTALQKRNQASEKSQRLGTEVINKLDGASISSVVVKTATGDVEINSLDLTEIGGLTQISTKIKEDIQSEINALNAAVNVFQAEFDNI